jgi:hypothetical protein
VPVVPLFPLPHGSGGHNSQKRGTGPGKYGDLSTGIDEVIFSSIWEANVRAGCGLARLGFRPGAGFRGFEHPLPVRVLLISVPKVPAIDDGLSTDPIPGPSIKERTGPHHHADSEGVLSRSGNKMERGDAGQPLPPSRYGGSLRFENKKRGVARLPPLTLAAFLDSGLNSGYYHTKGIPTGNPHLLNILPAQPF